MKTSYSWQPIRDLREDPAALQAPELRGLTVVWREQRERLAKGGQLDQFTEVLCREFAIETGILEHLYTLDRGVTRLLIEKGIDSALIPHDATNRDPTLVAAMIQDQHEAARSLFDFVGQKRSLSTAFIKELHALLTRHQKTTTAINGLGRTVEVPLRRGEWKKVPNNPKRDDGSVHEYAPPEQVASEMDRLLEWHREHEAADWPAEVSAAWLHHRFTQIHPFQDGNGRVARCLASLVLIRADWFYLAIDRKERGEYIESLEAADAGDLSDLVALVARQQRRVFIGALSAAREVKKRARVSEIIEATRRDLDERRTARREGWKELEANAQSVLEGAAHRFEEVREELATTLDASMPEMGLEVFVDTESPHGDRDYWFRYQVVQTARALGYYANLNELHVWTRLVLKVGSTGEAAVDNGAEQTEILLSIHGLGREYTGVLTASVSYFRKPVEKPGEPQPDLVVSEIEALTDEVFQINYVEDRQQTLDRFDSWLEDALARGLDRWRKTL